MPHSHDLPTELDLDAVRTIIDWVRQKIPFSLDVVEAGWCLQGYAMRQVTPAPRLVGTPADPRPIDAVALDTLEQLAAEQPISQGIIPWALLIEWLVKALLEQRLKGDA